MDSCLEKAKNHLDAFGLKDRILTFETSSATVELAAQAVGCEPERIAKSLSFITPKGPIVIVTAGDVRISNPKFKQVFSCKAKMIAREQVEEITGFPAGGVCPFGLNENVDVYLDQSLTRFDTVYPAAGTANSAVRLTPEELFLASRAISYVDIAK